VEQEPVNEQNVPMEADQIVDPPPPKQMRKISVQAGNGEDIILIGATRALKFLLGIFV
jgi:hypothetical protein